MGQKMMKCVKKPHLLVAGKWLAPRTVDSYRAMEMPLNLEPDDLNPGLSLIQDGALGWLLLLFSIFSPLELGYDTYITECLCG